MGNYQKARVAMSPTLEGDIDLHSFCGEFTPWWMTLDTKGRASTTLEKSDLFVFTDTISIVLFQHAVMVGILMVKVELKYEFQHIQT